MFFSYECTTHCDTVSVAGLVNLAAPVQLEVNQVNSDHCHFYHNH